jgi:hypothetical protein
LRVVSGLPINIQYLYIFIKFSFPIQLSQFPRGF